MRPRETSGPGVREERQNASPHVTAISSAPPVSAGDGGNARSLASMAHALQMRINVIRFLKAYMGHCEDRKVCELFFFSAMKFPLGEEDSTFHHTLLACSPLCLLTSLFAYSPPVCLLTPCLSTQPLSVHSPPCLLTSLFAHSPPCLPAHLPVCLLTSLSVCLPPCLPAHLPACSLPCLFTQRLLKM